MSTAELPRLNGIIKCFENTQVAFVGSGTADGLGQHEGTLFEMEHGPYDISELQRVLQSMRYRRQIAESGSIAPKITPIVRIPPNQGASNWIAKQVLDIGLYGIIWSHIDTVEEAYNAVAAMRYPKRTGHPLREPFGKRGDAPGRAAAYWGVIGQNTTLGLTCAPWTPGERLSAY